MIDRQTLLSDLQSLLKRLEADLLERTESDEVPEVGEWLRAEYQKAKDAERTAHTYKQWLDDFITQVAAAWVLSCVFVRFLEDNELIDPPRIAGPALSPLHSGGEGRGEGVDRLQQARDEHTLYFQDAERAKLTDREYLLDIFDGLAQSSAGKDVFGPHNPLRALPNWLGPDAAGELLRFFQKIDSDSGDLVHDFTDPLQEDGSGWDTRFLGDLYQDLSEAARKKYALLQTPDFVEEFILDRTLEPALDEFGLVVHHGDTESTEKEKNSKENLSDLRVSVVKNRFKMIDPACGSGHFLLGSFPRILRRWQQQEPGTNVRVLVQRTLDSIHGVDINPFAIAIARFRLLLAALAACGVKRLADAPAFAMNLACGDSLYHGRGERQHLLEPDWSDEAHYFRTEDADDLRRILQEGTFHAVVANPPYITPKDRAANQVYRRLYPKSCHMKYSLAVPFMERIFRLAVKGTHHGDTENTEREKQSDKLRDLRVSVVNSPAGFTGQITANSFMKREFGKKLIESFFPTMDLTHVIDTSGAYVPGHGTPTVILFARNRNPVSDTIRTVMGIRGEPSTPDDPSQGLVWSAIVAQIDQPGSESEFISAGDSARDLFHKHPWSIGGGGAAELKELLEGSTTETLSARSESIGITSFTLEDDVYLLPERAARRLRLGSDDVRTMVVGDVLRDWQRAESDVAVFPYDEGLNVLKGVPESGAVRYLWIARTGLANSKMFGGKTKVECGLQWYEYGRLTADKLRTPLSIVFAFVATHNHFVLDRGGKVFNRSAPVIKLPAEVGTPDGGTRPVTEDDHLALLGLLNSSTGCFWMKQSFQTKGSSGIGRGIYDEKWESFYEFTGTGLQPLPLPEGRPLALARRLDGLASELESHAPQTVLPQAGHSPRRHGEHGADDSTETDSVNSASPWCNLRESAATAREHSAQTRGEMIRLQEDLDWQCYRLYGLIDEDLSSPLEAADNNSVLSVSPWCNLPINLGERAFEIVLARRMARGEVQTTWFERHGSQPITELPGHWPDDFKQLVQRRIETIESNPQIALIEQPEYKRRWNTTPWEEQVEKALKSWLLDRLESYFDFDGRMSEKDSPRSHGEHGEEENSSEKDSVDSVSPWLKPPLADIQLVSVAKLADIARQDEQFMEVAEVYRDDPAFDVQKLVEELVQGEHVPLLPVLRYRPSGLRNRAEWEKTWELQRLEDKLRAGEDVRLSDYKLTDQQRDDIAGWQQSTPENQRADDRALDAILSIPVPPKYTSADFLSTGGVRYWSLRGKLDVPKERWVSFPHCEGPDGTLMIAWAGYNHLQLAQAISAYYVDVQERLGGTDDPRLVPLLGGIIELLPWLKQWHHDIDPVYSQRMDEVYEGFVAEEAKGLGMTVDEIKAWQPPKKTGRKKKK